MKKFVYLMVDEEKNPIIAYDRIDLATKLKPHIEKKLNLTLEIIKVRVNPDLAHI